MICPVAGFFIGDSRHGRTGVSPVQPGGDARPSPENQTGAHNVPASRIVPTLRRCAPLDSRGRLSLR
jgi:hypothetical protein